MVKRLNVALEDADFESIEQVKVELGYTWEDFVIEAAECLREREEE